MNYTAVELTIKRKVLSSVASNVEQIQYCFMITMNQTNQKNQNNNLNVNTQDECKLELTNSYSGNT